MGDIKHWTVEVCGECGLSVMDSDHATSSHQNTRRTRWVEVVPADQHQGAVEALRAIREQFANGRGGYDDDPVVRIVNSVLGGQ
jgi:hypothetical protein